MKFFILLAMILFQANLHAEVKEVTDSKELLVLQEKVNKETDALEKMNLPSDIADHLAELEKKINSGEIQLKFQSGNIGVRGDTSEDQDCGCSVINLSKEYIDSGVVSTLVHEFQHVKQHLLLQKWIEKNPELDKLTDIFGEYYYSKNEEMKKNPLFKRALFIGSALVFYMEYEAFKMQVRAIKAGIKDTLRKERSDEEVVETVANEYLIKHSITVDEKYIRKLASLADEYTITAFIEGLSKSKAYEAYFLKMQK